MNRIFTFLFFIALFATGGHTNAQSCCKKPTGMNALALNTSFKAAHLAPLPMHYAPKAGKMISFPVSGGSKGNAFYIPAEEPTNKVLFLFHEWWGLNDYIKREAENWHKMLDGKVTIYAIDLYDGKVATTPDQAGKLMSGLARPRGEAIVKGAIAAAGADKRIATIGWCMGGTWSFTASVLAGAQAAGCVMYYGFPEKDPAYIRPLKTDVLYIRAEKDDFIKETNVEEFERQVHNAGRNITVHTYNTVHAFANPSNPKYDAKLADEANFEALRFLREKLAVE